MRANYSITEQRPESLTIRDLGPWDRFATITNTADEVVAELVAEGTLREGQRLYYYDSEGRLDELLVREGRFAGFAAGPQLETL
jgi:hypothetical protein